MSIMCRINVSVRLFLLCVQTVVEEQERCDSEIIPSLSPALVKQQTPPGSWETSFYLLTTELVREFNGVKNMIKITRSQC